MSAVLYETTCLNSTVGVVTGPMLLRRVRQMMNEPARRKVLELTRASLRHNAALAHEDVRTPGAAETAEGLLSLALFIAAVTRGRLKAWPDEKINDLALSVNVPTSRWVYNIAGVEMDLVAHLEREERAALYEDLVPGPVTHVSNLEAIDFLTAQTVRDQWWHPAQVRLARTVMAMRPGDVTEHPDKVEKAVRVLSPEHYYELSTDRDRFTDPDERAVLAGILDKVSTAAARR